MSHHLCLPSVCWGESEEHRCSPSTVVGCRHQFKHSKSKTIYWNPAVHIAEKSLTRTQIKIIVKTFLVSWLAREKKKKTGRNSFFARSHSVCYCTICDIQCTGSAITRTAVKKRHSRCELPFFPASSASQRQHNNKLEAPLSGKHCSSLLHEKQIVFV